MTERQAWFCPACQKHHAPHCDSCPNPTVEVRPIPCVNVWPVKTVPYWPDPSTGDPQPWTPYWTGGSVYNPAFDPDIICINGAH